MTLLSLEEFRIEMQMKPWSFWGLASPDFVPLRVGNCDDILYQDAWRKGPVGRTEIHSAIEIAEEKLRRYLGYPVGPTFVETEVPWPTPDSPYADSWTLYQAGGRRISVKLPDAKLIAMGIKHDISMTDERVLVEYSPDDDEEDDEEAIRKRFRVSALIDDPNMTANQLVLKFVARDFYPELLDCDWPDIAVGCRLLPEDTPTNPCAHAVFRGMAWQMIRPKKYVHLWETSAGPQPLDAANTANYAEFVGMYQRIADPNGTTERNGQCILVWDNDPAVCNTGGTDPAAITTQLARCSIRDRENGYIVPSPVHYDADEDTFAATSWSASRPPDRLRVRYLAGDQNNLEETGRLTRRWRHIVAVLAAAEVERDFCDCHKVARYWQEDVGRIPARGDADRDFKATDEVLNCPFGTRRGQVEAWRWLNRITDERHYDAVAA